MRQLRRFLCVLVGRVHLISPRTCGTCRHTWHRSMSRRADQMWGDGYCGHCYGRTGVVPVSEEAWWQEAMR